MKSFSILRRLVGHTDRPFGFQVSRDGRILVSTSDERVLRVWNTRSGKQFCEIDDIDNPRQTVFQMSLSPDGAFLATGAADYTTKVFATNKGERVAQLSEPLKNKINSADHIAFAPNQRSVAWAQGKSVHLHASKNWTLQQTLKHSSAVSDVVYASNNSLLSVAGKTVHVWKSDGSCRASYTHRKSVCQVAVSTDASIFAVSDMSGEVIVRNLRSGNELARFTQHDKHVLFLAISPDNTTVASGGMYEGKFFIWKIDMSDVASFESEEIHSLGFSPNGKQLAVSDESGLHVFRLQDGKCLTTLPESPDFVFAPGGAWLAAADGNDVALYKMPA